MTADKSKSAVGLQPRCGVPPQQQQQQQQQQPPGDVPLEQRPEQLRSSMRQIGRTDGAGHGGKENGCDERVLRLSASAASLASDCGHTSAPSGSVSEASFNLDRSEPKPSGGAANLPTIPRAFLCPISSLVMTDPVSTVDGMHYDRASIEAFFRSGRQISPVTGQQLSSLTLLPNAALKEAIEAYLELRREAECQWRDWEAYMHEHAQRSQQKLGRKKQQVRELRAALESTERQVLALELSGKSKGYASSSAPSSSDRSTSSPLEGRERADEAVVWKAGPAPRPDPSTLKRPASRQRSLLNFFR